MFGKKEVIYISVNARLVLLKLETNSSLIKISKKNYTKISKFSWLNIFKNNGVFKLDIYLYIFKKFIFIKIKSNI